MRRKALPGWAENILYALLGLGLAFLLHQAMALALATNLPIVAVVSSSMEHHNPEVTHYGWLRAHLGYEREVIDGWPLAGGFDMGDMPIVRGTGDYEVGDVIVYTVAGQPAPIIHRIVRINPDGSFQTKGDNNVHQWPYELRVTREQIHGEVILIVPKLGWFKVGLTKLLGVW